MKNVHVRRFAAPMERVRPWIEACWSGGDRDCFPRDVIRDWRKNPPGRDPKALIPGETMLEPVEQRLDRPVVDGLDGHPAKARPPRHPQLEGVRHAASVAVRHHPEVEFHWPPSVLAAWGGNASMEGWDRFQPTAAERRMDPRVLAADEDVVVQWRWRAREPGGALHESPVLGVYRVRDGKLASARMFFFDGASIVDFLDAARWARAGPGAPERKNPLACDLEALTPPEREQRADLGRRLLAARRRTEPLDDGYAVWLPPEAAVARDALEFGMLERRCCPFLRVGIVFEPEGGPMRLELRGGQDVKRFLEAEMGLGQG